MTTCKECPKAYKEVWPRRVVIRCGANGPRKGNVIAGAGVPMWCPKLGERKEERV